MGIREVMHLLDGKALRAMDLDAAVPYGADKARRLCRQGLARHGPNGYELTDHGHKQVVAMRRKQSTDALHTQEGAGPAPMDGMPRHPRQGESSFNTFVPVEDA